MSDTPQTLAKVSNPITWTVQYKSNWLDAWSANDTHLIPTSVQFALAPTMPRATLIRHLGDTARLGTGEVTVTPLDLTGKFIKITLSFVDDDGDTSTKIWYGYCPDPVDNYEGTADSVSTGMTTYNCYGLEWFLRDTVVQTSIIYDNAAATGDVNIERVIPFNFTSRNRYGKTVGNRSTSKNASDVYEFNPSESSEWTGLDVVEHLLENWYRQTGSKFQFQLVNDAAAELANIKGSWNFQNQNYYNSIFSIVGPANAFSFKVTVNEVSNRANIDVFPTVSSDLKDETDTVIVTALDAKYVMDLDSDSRIAKGGARLQYLSSNSYDKIEIQGDWLRTGFTLSGEEEYGFEKTLDAGWALAEDAAYNTATDAERLLDDHTAIYGRLVVPDDWAGSLDTALTQFAFPTIDTDTGAIDEAIPQKVYLKNRIFERTLPWTEIDDESQPRRPFLVWKDDGGIWHYVDKPGDEYTALGLKMLDDQLGVQIVHGNKRNHITGKGEFFETSETSPEWDYKKSLVTVSMRSDEKARVIIDSPSPEPGELTRTKIIEMPQLAIWWIAPGTVKTIDPTQTETDGLVTVTDPLGEYTRNDGDKLLRAAYLAKELYGRTRQILSITYESMFLDDMVGRFVQEVQAGQTTQAVDTMVSDMTFTFEQSIQRLDVKTSFFEFSLDRVMGNSLRGTSSTGMNTGGGGSVWGNQSNDDLANIPVRQPSGGSPSSIFSSAYNSVTDQYELSWTAFDIQWSELGSNSVATGVHRGTVLKTIAAGTFKFDHSFIAASPSSDIELIICSISGEPVMYWTNEGGSSGTAGDATTNVKRMKSTVQRSATTKVQQFTIPAVVSNKNPLEIEYQNGFDFYARAHWDYNPNTDKFSMHLSSFHQNGDDLEQVRQWQAGASFSDSVIIGWTKSTGLVANDFGTNSGSYNDYRQVGTVWVDSSGNLEFVDHHVMDAPLEPFGENVSRVFVDHNLNTHTVQIYKGTIQSWTVV